MIKKLNKVFYTLKNLKPTQLAFFVLRRKFPARGIRFSGDVSANKKIKLETPILQNNIDLSDNQFCFLNKKINFEKSNINWVPNNTQRLWLYNLHYFDYLKEQQRSATNKKQLINSWVTANPQGSQPGWEPFTASLRIVNWVFYLCHDSEIASKTVHQSLYRQALWLEKNDERHILANHYFENLKALLFAGIYFEGKDAKRWRARAIRELTIQLNEQTLADGGHYERSPLYHCLMLENYLDIYNLAANNKRYFNTDFLEQFHLAIEQGLSFLSDIVFPDQQIPLFNDSAFGVAPALKALSAYAKKLGCSLNTKSNKEHKNDCRETDKLKIINKNDSGLYGLKLPQDMLLMDCGEIGPSYQPGHTHCDFLSYELMLGMQRIVVDTGVCEYEPGQRRKYLRSTKAHNTVSFNGGEQSEVWGEFRVARRAQKHYGLVEKRADQYQISGAYSGFFDNTWLPSPRIRHERKINVKLVKDTIDQIEVVDTLLAEKNNLASKKHADKAESFIHLHPDLTVIDEGVDCIVIAYADQPIVSIHIGSDCGYRLEESIYCPEFGIADKNICIVLTKQSALPITLSYSLKRMG